MTPANIIQVRLFLIVRYVDTDALGHREYDRLVTETQPIGPPNQFVLRVASEGVFWVNPQIRRIKLRHNCYLTA